MTARDVASGLSCLLEGIVIVGYLGVAAMFHSWAMLLAPVAIAGIAILWAIVRSRFDRR